MGMSYMKDNAYCIVSNVFVSEGFFVCVCQFNEQLSYTSPRGAIAATGKIWRGFWHSRNGMDSPLKSIEFRNHAISCTNTN